MFIIYCFVKTCNWLFVQAHHLFLIETLKLLGFLFIYFFVQTDDLYVLCFQNV